MANWQHKLSLKDIFRFDGGVTIEKLNSISSEIAKRLKAIDFKDEDFNLERDGIVNCFEDLVIDKAASVDEFDSLMNELYDFGDTTLDDGWPRKKLMWIET